MGGFYIGREAMRYENVHKGKFLNRPNRFVAHVEIDGKTEICHVKNTGRLKELLYPGVPVFVQASDNPNRKTKFDLIAVEKGKSVVNIDSLAPNKVFFEWVKDSGLFGNIQQIKPECRFRNSRFDYYLETDEKKIFVEVKGVTLEKNGVALFPDAPTERGVKHLRELCLCKEEGYEACAFFVVQMEGVTAFSPNKLTHPAFAEALCSAKQQGVHVFAATCKVSCDTLKLDSFIPVTL